LHSAEGDRICDVEEFPMKLILQTVGPLVALIVVGGVPVSAQSAASQRFRSEEIERELGVGYAVSLVDVNGDGKSDIVVVDQTRVVWYENPGWTRRTIIENQTKPDNVCIAPYDIDGDGQIDLALGADWRPQDTLASGTIQWLSRGQTVADKWTVHPIGTEPTVHRMRWGDFDNDGRAELIVLPLHGRGARPPEFNQNGVRILRYKIPDSPADANAWHAEVVDNELHVSHNLWPADLNQDQRLDLLVASFDGVHLLERTANGTWNRKLLAAGNQETSPNRGSSEIKPGRLGNDAGFDYLATIEPWHGFQVVVYTPSADDRTAPWNRSVIDEQLAWGHAVWCANLDDDPDEELVIGVRDDAGPHRSGVRIYDPQVTDGSVAWQRSLVDPGGVAVEDLAAADLDGDGDTDIVAAGRQTKNVKIYWNDAGR
jgi:hypothetical protein